MRLKQAVLAIPFVIVMANQGKAEAVCTLPITTRITTSPTVLGMEDLSVDFCRSIRDEVKARILSGLGDVKVDIEGVLSEAMSGMPLDCGSKVLTGANGSARIEIDNVKTSGVDCSVDVKPNSEFSFYGEQGRVVANVETVEPVVVTSPNDPSPLGTAVIVTTVVGGGAAAIAFSNKESLSHQ